jgi:hypothetical protein
MCVCVCVCECVCVCTPYLLVHLVYIVSSRRRNSTAFKWTGNSILFNEF